MTAGDEPEIFKVRHIPQEKDGKWPFIPNVEDLRELQRRLDRLDTHIVWVGPRTFVMAHTDEERANLGSLEECKLHQALARLHASPVKVGYYAVTPHVNDPTSESFRSGAIPWDFSPVEVPE